MWNSRVWRSIGISIPLITGLLLWGILEGMFEIGVKTNIWNTGITPGIVFGALNFMIAWAIWKNKL
jgi:predicted branched-subunit amino acid permease